MRRRLPLILLILVLLPLTWLRVTPRPPDTSAQFTYSRISLPKQSVLASHLGAFTLEAAWSLRSPDQRFGNYSALLVNPDGHAVAIGDRGSLLRFTLPDRPQQRSFIAPVPTGETAPPRIADAESVTRDLQTGAVWVGWENSNAVARLDPDLSGARRVRPAQMRDWQSNQGAEAMVRLADGRFVVLSEGYASWFDSTEHQALLFDTDPLVKAVASEFRFAGPSGFKPTDVTQLPDGRVLILMRKLVWPIPLRFAGRIVLADPRGIRRDGVWRGKVVARLSSSLPVDNFEAMAIEPGKDGRLVLWLMSDDNEAATQRTLLWKLSFDPKRLR